MMQPAAEPRESAIAIIGMACRFPGADTVEEFWRNLCDGRESTTFFTDKELRDAGVDPELIADPRYVKAAQLLRDVDMFDADYFGVTSEEAELLDPQQRLFLECAHEAFERSGRHPGTERAAIGVYAGVGLNTYLLNNLSERYRTGSTLDRYRLMLASDKDFVATRTSYKLDLRGPSMSVNTACSSSLVAVHLACVSLLSGECDMALAGGAHIKLPQLEGYLFQNGMIFSPDGRCRAFDARAQGTIVGDGVGVVVLKRLRDAVRDGDGIDAVIRGTAVNNDGGAKTGYTAPSVRGQAAVIAEAQGLAGCDAATISYVEAHGTGTLLGDAVELAALGQVFGARAAREQRCAVGSVKTNIGHLDCASGIAGLIKTALMLRHGLLVPTLHFTEPNPGIASAGSPFYVNTTLQRWPAGATPRRAGVSSFGIGGTNAHVVVEEPPAPEPAAPLGGCQLLVLSARSAAALERLTEDLARRLRTQQSTLDLADAAYTLAAGRRPHSHRRALVCGDAPDAAISLMLGDPDRILEGRAEADGTAVTFVFADQLLDGGGRAAALYRELPAFRDAVDRCLATPAAPVRSDPASHLGAGDAAAAVIAQCALAEVWAGLGVRPSALVGFGMGELAAACFAGVLTLPVALDLATTPDGGPPVEFTPAAPRVPLWSTADHEWMRTPTAMDPATWAGPRGTGADPRSLLATLVDGRCRLPLEMRPDALDPALPGREALMTGVGKLWTRGVDVDWDAFFGGRRHRRAALPTYPLERRRYWVEPPARPDIGARPPRDGSLRGQIENAEGPERAEVVLTYLQREVAAMLGLDSAQMVDPDQDLFSLGIGSLELIEIAARLSAELQQQVPVSLLVDRPTIRVFANNVAGA
jgi:acyl transferase domain-containing protein